jgi:uncharacterized protein YkwD
MRMLICAALATALIALAAPTANANAGSRRHMVGTINYVRGWSHARHLHFSPRLSRGAASWARSLMRRNVLAHSAKAMRRHEGEVIEWHLGGKAKIKRTVTEWLGSAEHRQVMLAHRYRRAGAGRAVGYVNGRRSTIWVVRFAR